MLTGLIYAILPVGFIPNEDKGFLPLRLLYQIMLQVERTSKVVDLHITHLLGDKKKC